jgi:hypothetical protein
MQVIIQKGLFGRDQVVKGEDLSASSPSSSNATKCDFDCGVDKQLNIVYNVINIEV